MSEFASDPPARPDGSCAVDGRPVPELARLAGDPFCTTQCCRAHYGVVFASDRRANATRSQT